MPTASVGAPPARDEDRVSRRRPSRSASASSGVTTKPQVEIVCAAASGVVPISAAGLFIAK